MKRIRYSPEQIIKILKEAASETKIQKFFRKHGIARVIQDVSCYHLRERDIYY